MKLTKMQKKLNTYYEKEKREQKWLDLLKEAVDEGAQIQTNYRYKYKGENLGTFLMSAKRKNKVKLLKKIKKVGFNFNLHSRDPEIYAKRFITDLSKTTKNRRPIFITRFNTYVLPKKEALHTKTIERINTLWKKKFGDDRKWIKPETTIDKIRRWKEYRYNEELNPEGKWLDYERRMGKLYSWVYTRKRKKEKMDLILEHFNKKEIVELMREGF